MRVITFASGKGGCGKTTAAVALAGEAVCRGLRVVLIDLDRQRSALDWRAVEAEGARPEVIGAGAGFSSVLESLRDAFDLAILDTPGRESAIGREAMLASDDVVIPCQPSPLDLWSASETLAVARQARGMRPSLKVRTLITRAGARRKLSREIVAALEATDAPPLTTVIHDRADYPSALAAGVSPATYRPDGQAATEIAALADELEIHA
jgi:chromosome partitioning protein